MDWESKNCSYFKRAAIEILRNHFEAIHEAKTEAHQGDPVRHSSLKGYKAF